VKMKRRAGRIRVKTSYLRRLCTRPSDITLSPTASYRAVGDKEAVGCLLVYCSDMCTCRGKLHYLAGWLALARTNVNEHYPPAI
jgi:hypothetical protein